MNMKVKTALFVAADVVAFSFSYLLAYLAAKPMGGASAMGFSGEMGSFFAYYPKVFLLLIIIKVIVLMIFSSYRILFAFAGAEDYKRLAGAVLSGTFVTATTALLAGMSVALYPNFILFTLLFDLLLVLAIRFVYVLFSSETSGRRYRDKRRRAIGLRRNVRKVMIFGSGEAALSIVREIKAGGETLEAVVIADDDRKHEGGSLLGVRIEGGRNDIRLLVRRHSVDEIIIAKPMAPPRHIALVLSECIKTRCAIRILPLYRSRKEAEEGAASLSMLRKPSISDLLGGDRPKVDHREIADQVRGRIVLITGAAGIFGSELALQLMRYGPRRLVAVDTSEDGLVILKHSLEKSGKGDIEIKMVIASVRDDRAMREVFAENRPHIVFHAAELKQIPFVQQSPREAYLTNVNALAKTASLAEEFSAMRFIHLSSTRAGDPDTVYAGLKKYGEAIVSGKNEQSQVIFSSVRIANLIEGRANVVALFEKQIKEGGPVTVIDKGFSKRFIRASEAALLTIMAGVTARGGEVFVVGPGESLGILELAEAMIRLAGYIPGEDIAVSEAQLRSGERNGLLQIVSETNLSETQYDKVLVVGEEKWPVVSSAPERDMSDEEVALFLDDLFPDHSVKDKSTVFRGEPIIEEAGEAAL
ncbi:MAG: polysaccharide biosynthesis protein [Clostridiales Family XIII bacterium]|jgi:FlaA1/EpsC-like NDP-sugar epimerase|nr:polysaccharide biosynthesis protein [Clostridiales Family XIII bacterium]